MFEGLRFLFWFGGGESFMGGAVVGWARLSLRGADEFQPCVPVPFAKIHRYILIIKDRLLKT